MGIHAINCKGLYAEVEKTGVGEGLKSASDFNNAANILSAAGMVALAALSLGCIEQQYNEKPEEILHAKSDHLLTTGTIRKENEFYWIQTNDAAIKPGQAIALYKDAEPNPSNICSMINDGPRPFDNAESYIVRCIKPVEWDDLKVADKVAVYLESPE